MNYRKDSDHNPQRDGRCQDRSRGIKFGLTLGEINPRGGLCFHPLVHSLTQIGKDRGHLSISIITHSDLPVLLFAKDTHGKAHIPALHKLYF